MKTWIIAVRPWAFSASIVPVILGLALVFHKGHAINWLTFILTLVGVVSFHAAANLLNDCFDYKRGIDTEVYSTSGAVVRGLLTESQVFRVAILFSAIGASCGFCLVYVSGWQVLALGLVGAVLSLGYTSTGICFKYVGMGDLAIFIAFGILPVFGTYWVQAQVFSWAPVLWSMPVVLYTVGILHANNWRDMVQDSAKNCTTQAGLLGERGSMLYYRMLLVGPFVLVLLYIVLGYLLHCSWFAPLTSLLVFLTLPMAINLVRMSRVNNAEALLVLDGKTAQMGMAFGLMLTLAFVVARLLERFN